MKKSALNKTMKFKSLGAIYRHLTFYSGLLRPALSGAHNDASVL